MKLVIVESPFAGPTPDAVAVHEAYARIALADCFARGEAPYASHLLYTQPGVLDDLDPAERKLGIAAGFAWGFHADMTAVYVDLGYSSGMIEAIGLARALRRTILLRSIGPFECACSACETRSRVPPACIAGLEIDRRLR
jgi:hypothetical protein